jgi:hypothetical protein
MSVWHNSTTVAGKLKLGPHHARGKEARDEEIVTTTEPHPLSHSS